MHFIYPALQMTLTLESPCEQCSLKEGNFVTIWELISGTDQHPPKLPHGRVLNNPSDTWLTRKEKFIFKRKQRYDIDKDKYIPTWEKKNFFPF